MSSINVLGLNIPVKVSHHDSMDASKEESTNQMVSFMVDGQVYQYLNIPLEKAADMLTEKLSQKMGLPPARIDCVTTAFRDAYHIEWPSVISVHDRT